MKPSALTLIACLLLTGCGPGSVSARCAAAFEAAASVSAYQDTHEDLFPAYSACSSVDEWKAASEQHPGAIDGAEPVAYVQTVCANNQAVLGDTPICVAVNQPGPGVASSLEASGSTGLLGVPLPKGATLLEKSPGSADADPRERYSISASAAEIEGFFSHAMPAAGWAKDGTSTDGALFFRRGDVLIVILYDSDGGTFTLAGS
ncbi:hypothetical protein BH23ACT12_BH23ACT12_22110 [soil metagenome]